MRQCGRTLLQVPADLADGDYVLSWRWDAEQGAQVWTTVCAALGRLSALSVFL
jgi:hypothetical protein